MAYIVMDLEWNQPVSKKCYPYIKIGDKMSNEIIQIGAYKISDELKIVDSFCAYIKPKYYKKLNSFVKRVTNIDKTMICEGDGFEDVIARFKIWAGESLTIFTWGSDDIYVMRQNLEFYGIDTYFIEKWYDMQKIFSAQNLGDDTQRSLSFAMEYFNIIKQENRQLHDALDDAYYTAKIFCRHDIDKCIKNYAHECDFKILCIELDDTSYGAFYTKNKAMADENVNQIYCPKCGKVLNKNSSWTMHNGKYLCVASCDEHGNFVSRIKLNKHLDGKFYVNKVTRKISDKAYSEMAQKCKSCAKKKRQPSGVV